MVRTLRSTMRGEVIGASSIVFQVVEEDDRATRPCKGGKS